MSVFRRHPLMTLGFALACAMMLFFAGRFVTHAIYWSDPAHREQQVQPWMTVGYVAKSWGLPPQAIDAEAGLARPAGRPMTLAEIAETSGRPVAEVIAAVEDAVARLRARGPGGGPGP